MCGRRLQRHSYYEGGEETKARPRGGAVAQHRRPSRRCRSFDEARSVGLSDVVKLSEGTGPSVINRSIDAAVLILANMQPGYRHRRS